ncbi:MAG: glycerophosphodiester phosphodiesterase, partial [Planctomycetota bacterium]
MSRCVTLWTLTLCSLPTLVLVTVAEGQMIVAHRGASADAPENTLAAFQLAWEQGADAIEGDFYLSADHRIVALHDTSTKRTSGIDWDVRKHTLKELRTLDVGSWKAPQFAREKIPTLEEVASTVPDGKTFLIEVKDQLHLVPHLAKSLQSLFTAKVLEPPQVRIICFDDGVISRCKTLIPEVQAFWLTSFKTDVIGRTRPPIQSILATLEATRADGLDCKAANHIDADFVRQLRARRYQFHVWTVDQPEIAARFQRLGVDSITT